MQGNWEGRAGEKEEEGSAKQARVLEERAARLCLLLIQDTLLWKEEARE